MKEFAALDVRGGQIDLVSAALDDFGPTALQDIDGGVRAFFLTSTERDTAFASLSRQFTVSRVEIPDDDWARRSQEGLRPITVGKITIIPNQQSSRETPSNESAIRNSQSAIELVIAPSMGFGTGHHATTRLCLAALQRLELGGKRFLDVGTGSGVLAIAARALGAAHAIGVDFDPDAIQSARENLALNPAITSVSFAVADLATAPLGPTDVVAANLTGALLVRSASTLLGATMSGGIVVLSGLMAEERSDVARAFASCETLWEAAEDEWVGLAVKKP